MKRVTFQITEDDIRLGKRYDVEKCPFARCVNRTLGRRDAHVEHYQMRWYKLTHVRYIALSAKATKWIGRFDEGQTVKPAAFTFWVPDDAAIKVK